jgi:hypothetical protein
MIVKISDSIPCHDTSTDRVVGLILIFCLAFVASVWSSRCVIVSLCHCVTVSLCHCVTVSLEAEGKWRTNSKKITSAYYTLQSSNSQLQYCWFGDFPLGYNCPENFCDKTWCNGRNRSCVPISESWGKATANIDPLLGTTRIFVRLAD